MSSSRCAPRVEGFLAIETFSENLYIKATRQTALPNEATIKAERAEKLGLNPEDVLVKIQRGEGGSFVFVYAKHGCRPVARGL